MKHPENAAYFNFTEKIWRITANEITEIDYATSDGNTIESKIENNTDYLYKSKDFFIDDHYFRIEKINGEEHLFTIEEDCQFFNFCKNITTLKDNKTSIGKLLFSYGYLLHQHKDLSKPWMVVLKNENPNAYGTGKGLFLQALSFFNNSSFIFGKKSEDIFEDAFLLDLNFENRHSLIFEDLSKNTPIERFYSLTTGDFLINRPFQSSLRIPHRSSPKIILDVENDYVISLNGSTQRRILEVPISDWYTDDSFQNLKKCRKPIDDFGGILFRSWDTKQWNKFVNFSAQAIQFYLRFKDNKSMFFK